MQDDRITLYIFTLHSSLLNVDGKALGHKKEAVSKVYVNVIDAI